MKTYYLVDFENMHEDSLSITQKATSNDEIILFYTSNSPKINLDYLEKHSCVFKYYSVKAGNQSLDMCLSSYLGYLIKSYGNKNKYVIVSADTDYDSVISFWKSHNITNASRKFSTKGDNKTAVKKDTSKKKNEKKPPSDITTELNNRIAKLLSSKGVDATVRGSITSIVAKNYKRGKKDVYLGIIQKFGQNDGLKYYRFIKKEL